MPFRTIIEIQISNLKLYLDMNEKLHQQKIMHNQQVVLPDPQVLTLASVTTLPVEHMFADLNRKHGHITMISFAQHWPAMLLEPIKKAISPEVLGFHMPTKRTYYPKTTTMSAEQHREVVHLEEQLLKLLQDYRAYRRKQRSSAIPQVSKEEEATLRDFALDLHATRQRKLRETVTKTHMGCRPMSLWYGKGGQQQQQHQEDED